MIKRDDLIDEYDCFDFDTDLSFNMDNQNKLVLDYTIIREDVTKDWANNKSRYTGRVEIEKSATPLQQHFVLNSFSEAQPKTSPFSFSLVPA